MTRAFAARTLSAEPRWARAGRQGSVRAGVAYAVGAAIVSGVAVFANGYGVRRFDDATVYTTAKNLVAALVLVAATLTPHLLSGRTRRSNDVYCRKAPWARLAVVGVVGGAVPFVLFFEGLARASSAQAAVIHKSLVIWVAVLAVPVLGERLTARHGAAIAVLVGAQVALGGGVEGLRAGAGEALVLAATLLWAVEFVLVKPLLGRVPAPVASSGRMGVGAVVLAAWLTATGRLGDLGALQASQWAWAVLTGAVLAAYVGLWYAALARVPAVDVAAVLVLGAVVTTGLAALVDGVPIAPDLLPLLAIVTAAAALAARPAPRAAT